MMAVAKAKSKAPKLSKFEKARIIGARALQLALGAPPLIKTSETDPLDIAEAEFHAGKIPMAVVRELPGGETVRVDVG